MFDALPAVTMAVQIVGTVISGMMSASEALVSLDVRALEAHPGLDLIARPESGACARAGQLDAFREKWPTATMIG